jgi:hypothetical protein
MVESQIFVKGMAEVNAVKARTRSVVLAPSLFKEPPTFALSISEVNAVISRTRKALPAKNMLEPVAFVKGMGEVNAVKAKMQTVVLAPSLQKVPLSFV